MLDDPTTRLLTTTTAAFTLGLLLRGVLLRPTHPITHPSPLRTLLPNLPPTAHSQLPYPPDSLPSPTDTPTPYGSIRSYEFGPTNGRKVLLIHGISTPCLALGGVAHQLADRGCRVLLFDLFGRGYSDNPGDLPHDLRLFTTQILLVLAASELSWKKFDVVGYSLGGGIAAGFAAYFPSMVDNLVLLCPAGLIRVRHFSRSSKMLYSEGVIPEPILLRLVKRRLKTPLYPPKKRAEEEGKVGAAKAVEGEVPLESNSKAVLSKKYPGVTIDKAVVHQVDHHEGFVSAFMSSIRYGPIQEQHKLWDRIRDGWSERSDNEGRTHKVLVVAGDTDAIIDAKELREDATGVFGEHIEFKVVEAGHDAPIVKAAEVAEMIWEAWN